MPDDWLDEEIDATVREYFLMMEKVDRGEKFVKTHVYKALEQEFPARSWKAFERKFCNISAVLDEMGKGWLPGLKPLRNIQNRLRERVHFFLSVNQPSPTVDSSDESPTKTAPQETETTPDTSATTPSTPSRPSKKQGRPLDPRVKKAVELRAMDVATESYRRSGYSVEDVSGNHPFDLRCTDGHHEIHVEVKGTQGAGETVVITGNELKHARDDSVQTDLAVTAH